MSNEIYMSEWKKRQIEDGKQKVKDYLIAFAVAPFLVAIVWVLIVGTWAVFGTN